LREEEPRKPSTRIRTQDPATSTEVAHKRQTEPSALARQIRGDLDSIALKALEKERSRRYGSPAELAADIGRYLRHEAVVAVPPSVPYLALKFVRRHRIGVASVAALAATLIAGVAVSLHEARVAQRRFAQVRELANTFLFQFYDQVTPLAGSTKVRASIVDTARKYLDGLAAEAGSDTGLILELAQAYQRLGDVQGRTGTANLGQVEEARRSYQRALDLYARLPVNAGSPADLRRRLASALWALGRLEYSVNREDAAEPVTRRMLHLLEDRAPDGPTRKLRAIGDGSLGQILLKQGHSAEAVKLMESARQALLDLRASGYSDPGLPGEIITAEERLARARASTGDLDGALSVFLELLRSSAPCDEAAPPGSACRTLAVRLSWTADVYAAVDRPNLGEPAKAAPLYQQALQIQERIAALDAHDRQARFDLASRYGKLGDAIWQSDPKRALELYDRALATARELASKEQFEILQDSYLGAISRPLIQLGRTAEARQALTESLRRGKTDAQSPYADRLGEISARMILPRLLVAEGKRAEARRSLEEVGKDFQTLRGEKPGDLAPVYFLSLCYRQLASIATDAEERRHALLKSAAAWHSWPATSFTIREEQKDLAGESH
jgi:tetratricopeptide (TPR) repeat protein